MKWLTERDVLAGLLFVSIGLVFAVVSATYRIGTPANMGPGLFPLCLGVLLTVLGSAVVIKALWKSAPVPVGQFRWGLVILILLSIAVFGLALPYLGLPLTVVALVIVSLRAAGPISWPFALATAATLAALSVAIFIYALSLPIDVAPQPWQ